MPASWTMAIGTLTKARSTSSSPNVSSNWMEASAAKPMSEAPRKGRAQKMRRSVAIFQTMRDASP
jgi:hypothetical protein